MSKSLIALLLISLISVSQQATATATFTCKLTTGASANNGVWNAPAGYTTATRTCVDPADTTTGTCAAGFSDNAPASGVNVAVSTTGQLQGDCNYCTTTDHFLTGPLGASGVTCVLKGAATSTCLATFSDKAASAAVTAALVANCDYCATSTPKFDRPKTIVGVTCVAQTATCAAGYVNNKLTTISTVECVDATTGICASPHTDKYDGSAASTTTAKTSDCKYCLTTAILNSPITASGAACVLKASEQCAGGYTDLVAGTENTAAKTGNCTYCISSTHVYDRISSLSEALCVTKASGPCAGGYTDKADGTTASTSALTGNCQYCLKTSSVFDRLSTVAGASCVALTTGKCETGYTDSAGNTQGSTTTPLASACTYCAEGYKDTAGNTGKTTVATTACTKTTDTPAAGTSGNYLQGFVCFIFVILSILL